MTFLNRHRSRIRPVGPFAPSSLFFGGIPGAWYDPTDLSTMFQDSTGTTPVTAVEQPVGLILDKSQGLALGAELVTNGDFSGGTTGWSVSAGGSIAVVGGKLQVTSAGGGVYYVTQSFATTVGKTYRMQGAIAKLAPAFTAIRKSDNATASVNVVNLITALGSASGVFVATSATTFIVLQANGLGPGDSAEFDDISIRELAGNHASQSTAASRPTYRARYNLLTYSEQLNDLAWTQSNCTLGIDAGVAPDGTMTAEKLIMAAGVDPNGATGFGLRYLSALTSGIYTYSIYAKAAEFTTLRIRENAVTGAFMTVDLITGAITGAGAQFVSPTATALANGWWRVSWTSPSGMTDAGKYLFRVGSTGDGVSGILVWGAQLLTAADVTATGNAYQRIAAATVYDTAPIFRPYLAFDGMDDSLSTAAINFTSTNKMTVCTGLSKLSDATLAIFAELSTVTGPNAGSWYIAAPITTGAGGNYSWRNAGTALSGSADSGTLLAPNTSVLTGTCDIGTLTQALRVNGALAASGIVAIGGGNYGNWPLFIGRRNNSTFPFNGRIYSLIVRGAASSVTEIADTELWVNARTGAY